MANEADWKAVFEKAILAKSRDGVRQALAAGMPVNGYDEEDGEAPIHKAVGVYYSDPGIVEELIAAGADVNLPERVTPTKQFAVGRTALMSAVNFGNLKIFSRLLEAGADATVRTPGGHTAFTYAGGDGAGEQIFYRLLSLGTPVDERGFWRIVVSGNPRMVRTMIDRGIDINAYIPGVAVGYAIHATVVYGKLGNLYTLLRAGVDLTARLPAETEGGYGGMTALDVAKHLKMKPFIKALQNAERGEIPEEPVPRQVTPADLPEVWKELEKVLKKVNPEVRSLLRKGAKDKALTKLGADLGVALPTDFEASLRAHDGQEQGDGVIPGGFMELGGEFCLLGTADIVSDRETWQKLLKAGEFKGLTPEPDEGVAAAWWHEGWIPFASDGGGNSLCIDTAPTDKGVVGQVVYVEHESPRRARLAGSVTELLMRLVEHLTPSE